MTIELLLYLWPITLAFGFAYRVLRWTRRDLVLHLAFSVGVGLSLAVIGCLGFGLVLGGWGPPLPEFFGLMGFVGGIAAGLGLYCRAADKPT